MTDWDDYDEVLAAVTINGTDLENADDDLKEEEEVYFIESFVMISFASVGLIDPGAPARLRSVAEPGMCNCVADCARRCEQRLEGDAFRLSQFAG